jgi:DNA-3-methyladenine glycosylase II
MSERTREAAATLAASDPAMATLIERIGTVDLVARFRRRVPAIVGEPFDALLRSIVGQQLSTTSAEAIFGRFVALADEGKLTPAVVLAASDADLRKVGLSGRKVEYVRDLAARVEDGRLDLHALRRLDDDEVVAAISAVRGLGRWSAELFLLFHLHRPDVFPAGDLVLRRGVRDLYDLELIPVEAEARKRAERWRPQRSLAAMYLWELASASRAEVGAP